MSDLRCPKCEARADRLMGHEEQGVYDGVLWWSCLECGHAWPRDFGDWTRLNEASQQAVERARVRLARDDDPVPEEDV